MNEKHKIQERGDEEADADDDAVHDIEEAEGPLAAPATPKKAANDDQDDAAAAEEEASTPQEIERAARETWLTDVCSQHKQATSVVKRLRAFMDSLDFFFKPCFCRTLLGLSCCSSESSVFPSTSQPFSLRSNKRGKRPTSPAKSDLHLPHGHRQDQCIDSGA